jgi:hypothetical protein
MRRSIAAALVALLAMPAYASAEGGDATARRAALVGRGGQRQRRFEAPDGDLHGPGAYGAVDSGRTESSTRQQYQAATER